MTDIFDNQILCKKCSKAMKSIIINKNGFNLRAIKCDKCNELIVHPADKAEYEEFMRLKNKEFEVKMRMVGNSYAVSIPREIVDFMREQEKMLNDMVKLSFEQAGRLSLAFNTSEMNDNLKNIKNIDSQVIKAREVKIVKNNKPVLHARQFYDSKHPERNQTKIFRANKLNQDEELSEN